MTTRKRPFKLKDAVFEPVYSLKDLRKGLETLNTLWEAGNPPEVFRFHHHMTWFALHEGNLARSAKAMNAHRNNVYWYFCKLFGKGKSIGWRYTWQKIKERHPQEPFGHRFFRFWNKRGFGPKITLMQSKALNDLWKTGFPYKMIKASFLLWAHRKGKGRKWIMEVLKFRHRNHYLQYTRTLKAPGSITYYWFAPFNPTALDWRPYKKPGRPKKNISFDAHPVPVR